MSVGTKLLLIYLLDLTAVIYISSILINEKYIAINFSRDELRGNAYIATARDGLIDVALVGAGGFTDVRSRLPARITALSAVEQRLGKNMGSAELNAALVEGLGVVAASPPDEMVTAGDALARGRELVTRVGNQSKLILDPDLDSYYTMSLIVLRYPELLELVHGIGAQAQKQSRGAGGRGSDTRTQYLILEGRCHGQGYRVGLCRSGCRRGRVGKGCPDAGPAKACGRHRSLPAGSAHIHRPRAGHRGNGRAR